MIRAGRVLALAAGLLEGAALAEPGPAGAPVLAAVAAGPAARDATLIGPSGQVYAPDGHGGWRRTRAGGVGSAVLVATQDRDGVIIGAEAAPPFRLGAAGWTALPLTLHAKAVVARGPRPIAAVGRQVFALDRTPAQALPAAPAAVTAIGASSRGVVIATERGLARLDGGAWQALAGAPRRVVALASDRWAITAEGAVDLTSHALVAWPTDVTVTAYAAAGDGLLAAGASAAGVELVTVRRGAAARQTIPLAPPGTPVGVAGDHADAALIALADGRVLVRQDARWVTITVTDELPAPRPGAGPALAK